jgi:hypothetical protein
MIPPLPLCGAILPPATHWAWTVFAAALGVAAGRVLVGLVGGLLDRGVFADDVDIQKIRTALDRRRRDDDRIVPLLDQQPNVDELVWNANPPMFTCKTKKS